MSFTSFVCNLLLRDVFGDDYLFGEIFFLESAKMWLSKFIDRSGIKIDEKYIIIYNLCLILLIIINNNYK